MGLEELNQFHADIQRIIVCLEKIMEKGKTVRKSQNIEEARWRGGGRGGGREEQ